MAAADVKAPSETEYGGNQPQAEKQPVRDGRVLANDVQREKARRQENEEPRRCFHNKPFAER